MTAPSVLTREEIARTLCERRNVPVGSCSWDAYLADADAILALPALSRLPAQASQEEIATIAGWALCAEENGGGPGKCDLNKCVCGSEGKAVARALVARLPAQAAGEGDDDCEDQGMMATDVCVKFGCNNAPLVRRGRDWCCSNCGISYGEGAKDGALPSPPAEPSGEMVEADASMLICCVDAAIEAIEHGSTSAPILECLKAGRTQFLEARNTLRAALSRAGEKP